MAALGTGFATGASREEIRSYRRFGFMELISAMNSECECVFSQTKRLITDDRNRLSPKAIEASQC
jgi:hypothetical protein